MTLATRAVAAYLETGSATQTARRVGCARRTVYTFLRRAEIPVRAYRRQKPRAPLLRLVTEADAFNAWQAARKRAIDRELRDLRRRWRMQLAWAVQPTGPR